MSKNLLDCMEAEFISNGTVQVLDVDGLYEVRLVGNDCWFLLYQVRISPNGTVYREPAFYCRMPVEAVGPGIVTTVRELGLTLLGPAVAVLRRLFDGALMH